MGTTRSSQSYRLRLQGLNRSLQLVDTPGILEAGREAGRAWSVIGCGDAYRLCFVRETNFSSWDPRPFLQLLLLPPPLRLLPRRAWWRKTGCSARSARSRSLQGRTSP